MLSTSSVSVRIRRLKPAIRPTPAPTRAGSGAEAIPQVDAPVGQYDGLPAAGGSQPRITAKTKISKHAIQKIGTEVKITVKKRTTSSNQEPR